MNKNHKAELPKGYIFSLPSEAEWEKAARGEFGNECPWGNEFDPQKANTSESRIGHTSDVGRFSPDGDSPYGCADMAGNVWEWCSDWFNENEYQGRADKFEKDPAGPQNGQDRVLRGGSFYNNLRSARCAVRLRDYPDYFSIMGKTL